MARYEVKEDRLRLICEEKDKEKVLENIKKYPFLKVVGTYLKPVKQGFNWCHIIVDSSDSTLDTSFVNKFNKEVNQALGVFENYDPYFD